MSSRHSFYTATTISYAIWLVLSEDGDVKLSRRDPALKPRERAVRMTIGVPRALFKTPAIKATVNIPGAGANASGEIEAAVSFVSETLKGVFGGDIKIVVGEED